MQRETNQDFTPGAGSVSVSSSGRPEVFALVRTFTLIAVGQPGPLDVSPFDGRLQTLVVPNDPANDEELARARIPRPSFYCLRPDGYVGLAGTRLEAGAVARYLSERIGVRLERGAQAI